MIILKENLINLNTKNKKRLFLDIKLILNLAIPVILENILQTLLSTTDTLFAGKLNSNAIAGIGATNLIMNIYIALFTFIGVGTTVVIARNIGAGKIERANDVVRQSIILSIIISIFLGIISLIFSREILNFLGIAPQVLKYAIPYFNAVSIPNIFLCLSMVLGSSLRGAGNTKKPMVAGIIANVLNIVLNYILMFGIFNFHGLGILGSGLATTIARMISAFILLIYFFNGTTILKINLKSKWKIDKNIIKSICKIGGPAGIEKLIMRIGQLIYGFIIISLGTQCYVAHNIAGTIESYSYLPAMGFAVVASTLVGQNLGKNNLLEAKRYALISNILSTIFMIFIGIIFFVTAPFLAKEFTQSLEIQNLVISVIRIIALFQPLLSLTFVMSSALQGAGDTKFPMYLTFIGIWGIRIILGYTFAVIFNLGLIGIWIAYSIDISFRGIILLVRFLKGKWISSIIT